MALRRRFSARARICKHVFAAQQALTRRDFQAFDQNLQRSRQMAEKLWNEGLRLEFRGDLALLGVQGAYWCGDIAAAEQEARRAIEVLTSVDPADRKGKLCMVHVFLGDIFLDREKLAEAAEAFRAAANLAERSTAPFAAIFPLQKLADALLEAEKRDEAVSVIDHCVEIENEFYASGKAGENLSRGISMTAPDQSLVRSDFATAERLFDEKVRYFAGSAANSTGIDVLRYQLHLAEAQYHQGNIEKAQATLTSACAAVEEQFGSRHPRVERVRRKLESLRQH
ncbi:hypothetical protein [Paludibaculum fermentans]|uniref:Tetratricopeptide repeat protein n=1 Tax=Paludibaculum fermentans TaxID=1473598 RepID=A0A7S7NPZ9_PALFE|nr:hypothetical protein [Paludibaculum fermentans]QOY87574.1 hypothetical protein IRI77_33275 [Paludibaculum fermentans]